MVNPQGKCANEKNPIGKLGDSVGFSTMLSLRSLFVMPHSALGRNMKHGLVILNRANP